VGSWKYSIGLCSTGQVGGSLSNTSSYHISPVMSLHTAIAESGLWCACMCRCWWGAGGTGVPPISSTALAAGARWACWCTSTRGGPASHGMVREWPVILHV
jgi:hypothetical protein